MTAVHVATGLLELLMTTSMVRGYWLAVCLLLLCGSGWVRTPGRKTTQARAPPCLASGCSLGSVVSDSETPWTVAHQAHGISQARILEWVAISFSRVHSILKINLFLIGG